MSSHQPTVGGFPVLDVLPVPDPAAVRLLPAGLDALAVELAGDVARVVCPSPPSPARYRELERAAGCLITVEVATAEVWSQLTSATPRSSVGVDIAKVLEAAVQYGASDVHLSAGTPPVLRVAGRLVELDTLLADRPLSSVLPGFGPLSASDCEDAARWVAGERIAEFNGDLDLGFSHGGQRWRGNIWRQRGSLALSLRLIPGVVPRLEQLGLPAGVVQLASLTSGLVLFCGPTGSGKSTTMAAIVDRINRTRDAHIVTIEDPIEYVHTNRLALVRQREVGADTAAFATALRAALRQDPDVLLVGELRDEASMEVALQAAETGHLVLATVHASSTAGAIARVVNGFSSTERDQVRSQLSASLQAVVSQLLMPATQPGRRALACEVLLANTAVRAMVRDNRLHEIGSTLETSVRQGMTSMDRSLARLVADGIVDRAVAQPFVTDEKGFEAHMSRRGFDVDPSLQDDALGSLG